MVGEQVENDVIDVGEMMEQGNMKSGVTGRGKRVCVVDWVCECRVGCRAVCF